MESLLVRMCIEAATESADAVEKWRRQRRTLERMPSHLADDLLRNLLRRRLLFPSLLEVFKYNVEEVDLKGESCVDAEWMAYIGAFRYLHSLILADCHRINNSAVWSLTGMTNLKELDLSRCSKVTDDGIRHLLSVPSLEKLCISETGVTADGVAMLSSLTNLLVLDLGGLPVTDSALSSLQALTKLQHLDLWGSEISNQGAVLLKMFPSLSFLNLGWTYVTNLPDLCSLACINMSNCTIHSLFEGEGQKVCLEKVILSGASVADVSEALKYVETSKLCLLDISKSSIQSFSFLCSMNALTDLNLSDCALVDDSVEHIARVGSKLRYLNLSNTKVSSNGIGILAGHVPNLETLLLSGTPVDDKAILYISMMPWLKVINLSKTKVKGLIRQEDENLDDVPSFSALETLSQFERLDLEMLQIKDTAIFPIPKLSNLSYLSLQSASLTDLSLHQFSSSGKLTHLGVRDSVLTDGGIVSFVPPPTLEVLDLRGCWLLTQGVLLHFCNKYPHIELRHELVNIDYSSPLRANMRRTSQSKHKRQSKSKPYVSPVSLDETFLDQRLKYSREELLAMQFSSMTCSTSHSLG
ncbi:hypothetical protein CASFOL_020238 [Castilleja foliolosa]|uniref:Uncharacterized protein n=1 Tax=Castilleja foliolosa TaxID=1961234 RepID=A0ABD3D0A5_9LAMI